MARQDTGVSILLKADRRYTYRDYRSWPEKDQWEFLKGTHHYWNAQL